MSMEQSTHASFIDSFALLSARSDFKRRKINKTNKNAPLDACSKNESLQKEKQYTKHKHSNK